MKYLCIIRCIAILTDRSARVCVTIKCFFSSKLFWKYQLKKMAHNFSLVTTGQTLVTYPVRETAKNTGKCRIHSRISYADSAVGNKETWKGFKKKIDSNIIKIWLKNEPQEASDYLSWSHQCYFWPLWLGLFFLKHLQKKNWARKDFTIWTNRFDPKNKIV